MLVADLEGLLERLAPTNLAEPGDNCGLLVGSEQAAVHRILVALEVTRPVLDEAVAGGYDTILSHHPLLFSPLRTLVDSRSRERLVRGLVSAGISLFACHTNLDSAPGGLAELVGEALGLKAMRPLRYATANWYKLVGFLPPDSAEEIAAAVFAAGAGTIGDYRECAFALEGRGWFTPGSATRPTIGEKAVPQRVPEVRWETVVPRARLAKVIAAYVETHPYEEPAFDVYPVEDVVLKAGIGRAGTLVSPVALSELAGRVTNTLGLDPCSWTGDGDQTVTRVGVVPGSGRSLIEEAAALCEVLITGDLGHHDAERASDRGLSLIHASHGDLEWWALRRWAETFLVRSLVEGEVTVSISQEWRSPWERPTTETGSGAGGGEVPPGGATIHTGRDANTGRGSSYARIYIDGGSRGNPGPSAIGVVVEDAHNRVLETLGRAIGVATNNIAEYRALLTGLELAKKYGARKLEIFSDSELLVRQMSGEYRVKNEGLRPLHAEALAMVQTFDRVSIEHVLREDNTRADQLVNQALDETSPT